MPSEIRTLDVLELWSRPRAGKLAAWVCAAVALGCAVTVTIAALGARVLWRVDGRHLGKDPFWFCNGLAIAIALVVVASFLPASKMSRFVRVAVALPIVHLVAMVLAWAAFTTLADKLVTLRSTVPMLASLSIGKAVLVFGAASLAVAWLAARKRRGELLHALVMMTLVHLLVLGLWLPIAARLCVGGKDIYIGFIGDHFWTRNGMLEWMDGRTLRIPPALVATALLPAFAVAAAFTALAIRRPRWMRACRGVLAIAVVTLVVVGGLARMGSSNAALIVFDNFTHVLFALAFLAIAALGALGVATWVRPRAPAAGDRTWCSGAIASDDDAEVVGCIEISSWLRGPRALVRPFSLRTAAGELPVVGARLVATLPLVTSVLRGGEAAVVLRVGDRVHVGGFVERHDGDHPFRAMTTLVPGPSGLVVLPAQDDAGGLGNAALALWRPSIAYLAILIAVALPALAGALTPPSL